MSQNIYTIYDSAAKYYMPIFLAKTDDEAERMFTISMDQNYRHRSDYTLMRVGIFLDDTGVISATSGPEKIVNGLSIPDTAFPPDPNQLDLNINGLVNGASDLAEKTS